LKIRVIVMNVCCILKRCWSTTPIRVENWNGSSSLEVTEYPAPLTH